MLNRFSRTQLLLGKEGMDRLVCFCAGWMVQEGNPVGAGHARPAACL